MAEKEKGQLTKYEAAKNYPLTKEEIELEAQGYENWLKTLTPKERREHEKKVKMNLKKLEEQQSRLVNFRLKPDELEGLRILAELTGCTQTEIIRGLINEELRKQEEAIAAYKEKLEEARAKIKK